MKENKNFKDIFVNKSNANNNNIKEKLETILSDDLIEIGDLFCYLFDIKCSNVIYLFKEKQINIEKLKKIYNIKWAKLSKENTQVIENILQISAKKFNKIQKEFKWFN